jgi:YD repeat-containing protein
MKKILLSISIIALTFFGCKTPETIKPIIPRTVVTDVVEAQIIPEKEIELSGKIFVDGIPRLKKTVDVSGTITEFFYNERKHLARRHQEGNNPMIMDYLYFYDGGELVRKYDFVKNPNYILNNSFAVLITDPIFCEYDSQGRVTSSKSISSKNTYLYENDGLLVKEFSISYKETNPVNRLNSIKIYDENRNNLEIKQGDYIAKYTFDNKINPLSFSPRSKENNPISFESVGGWSGDVKETYQYKYNQYNLPIERKDSKGNILTYTYYE